MMFSPLSLRMTVLDAGGLFLNRVSVVHLAFIFHILCYDPACVQLETEAYDTIDPAGQYPACGVQVLLLTAMGCL